MKLPITNNDLVEHMQKHGMVKTPAIMEAFRAVDRGDFATALLRQVCRILATNKRKKPVSYIPIPKRKSQRLLAPLGLCSRLGDRLLETIAIFFVSGQCSCTYYGGP